MTHIDLPISKSIANRLLVLQAIRGVPLSDFLGRDIPDDVRLMHDALEAIGNGAQRLDLQNCGTAMRFLTAYCAQLAGKTIVLDGSERMRQRPIGPLVEALRLCGAEIAYLGEEGFPPMRISGQTLVQPEKLQVDGQVSTQFISALLLIGLEVETKHDSPYVAMTGEMLARWEQGERNIEERDWSAAAFWYEYVALHGGELFLEGLHETDLQGDKTVAEIFEDFGVETRYEEDGVAIRRREEASLMSYSMSFRDCPDLYPAVAMTCEQFGIELHATDTDTLRLKESDRLRAILEHQTYGDHRIAMALLAADLPCDNIECINKSYPTFYEQLCQLRG